MRNVLVLCAAVSLGWAQVKVYTVKEDNTPLRAGCADNAEELARLKQGDAVKLRFSLAGTSGPCYKIAVEMDGRALEGYVRAEALTGIEQFDQERRKATAEALARTTRGTGAAAPSRRRASAGAAAAPAPAVRPVPEFSLAGLENPGTTHSRRSMAGKTYMIDFWATWCGPCRTEMPHLHQAYEKYRSRNFEILSVSLDEKREDPIRFRNGNWKMPWLHAFSAGGFRSEAAQQFGVTGLPSALLVDSEGRIIATGASLRGGQLDRTLARVLR